jgi:hypothetical protein
MESIPVIATYSGIQNPEVALDEIIIISGGCLKVILFSISGLEPVRITISGMYFCTVLLVRIFVISIFFEPALIQ